MKNFALRMPRWKFKKPDWKLPAFFAAAAVPKVVHATTAPVDDLSYLPMSPLPSTTPKVPDGYRRIHHPGVVEDEVEGVDTEKQKTAKDHALQVMHDLPLGLVMRDSDPDEPVTNELTLADLSAYAKSSTTKGRIMTELAGKGVVVKRPKRSAIVVDAYQYKREKSDSDAERDSDTREVVDAIRASYGKNRVSEKQALDLANQTTGELNDRIRDAFKLAGSNN